MQLIVNHDWERGILAHRADGNLFLAEDSTGLYFEAKLPNTELGQHIRAFADTVPYFGCSFDPLIKEKEFIGNGITLYRQLALREVSILTTRAPAIGAARAWLIRRRS